LETNLGITTLRVQTDDAAVSETWEEGAGADAILILLDGLSAPTPLRREDWKALIDHDNAPPIAFVRLEDCAYPKLLERRPIFPSADPLQLDRAVERWLASQLPHLPGIHPAALSATVPAAWWTQLVDQPGHAETDSVDAAQAFAHDARPHFQNVIWIGCHARESAVIRAELDFRLFTGRSLVVLANLDKPCKLPGGQHSYISVLGPVPAGGAAGALGAVYPSCFQGRFATELGTDLSSAILLDAAADLYRLPAVPLASPGHRQQHLELLQRYFHKWRDNPDPCRALLPEVPAALEHGFLHDWPRAAELARRSAFLLVGQGRRREAIRLFNRLRMEAETHGDAETAADALHELSWLTGDEDAVPAAPVESSQVQLSLFG